MTLLEPNLRSTLDELNTELVRPSRARHTRGTSNGNVNGNSEDRRSRRGWLVQTYRANFDLPTEEQRAVVGVLTNVSLGGGVPCCRCYRCGVKLTVDTVTVDRIVPGVRGGTYRRNNIRPSCARCNSEIGGALTGSGKRKVK